MYICIYTDLYAYIISIYESHPGTWDWFLWIFMDFSPDFNWWVVESWTINSAMEYPEAPVTTRRKWENQSLQYLYSGIISGFHNPLSPYKLHLYSQIWCYLGGVSNQKMTSINPPECLHIFRSQEIWVPSAHQTSCGWTWHISSVLTCGKCQQTGWIQVQWQRSTGIPIKIHI